MKNIWKVKQGNKRKLEDVLNVCKKGDIILLSPGEYHFPKGLFFNKKEELEIRGIGKEPGEVVINGFIAVSGPVKCIISNVTFNAPSQKNALNINDGATIELHNTVVNGELTGDYPAIWCEHSNIEMAACEVYFSEEVKDGVYICEQSEVKIRSSIISSLTASQSNVQLHNNQIHAALTIENDSIVNTTGVLDFTSDGMDLDEISVQAGARAKFDLINADSGMLSLLVENAALTVKEVEGPEISDFHVLYNKQSTVDVPEGKVNLSMEEEMQTTNGYANLNQNDESDDTSDRSADREISEEDGHQESAEQQSGLEELYSLYGLHDSKKKSINL